MQVHSPDINDLEGKASVQAVDHLNAEAISPSLFFQHYQAPGRPVLLSGLLGTDIDWNLDYLCEQLGNTEFPIRHYGRQRYQQDKRTWNTMGSGVETTSLPFNRYAELLRSGEAHEQDLYLGKCSLTNTPLADASAIRQAEKALGLRWPVTDLRLWVGAGEHTTCLHYDPVDSVLIQLSGAKRVVLFPPSQLNNLYLFSVWNHLFYGLKRRCVYSQVYPDQPDFAAFPRFNIAQQHRSEVQLNPGDILFIPAGWAHEVSSLGGSRDFVCSINRFWHVYPLARAFRLWSKWRVHFGGVLAGPHILASFVRAIASRNRDNQLSHLIQRI